MKRVLSNNLYMIRYVWRYCPVYVILSFCSAVFSLVDVGINVLFVRYIIDSLTMNISFSEIVTSVIIVTAISIVVIVFHSWFNNYYYPFIMHHLHRQMQGTLISKALDVELECYDNPDFYDHYILAINNADYRALETLKTVTDFVRNILVLLLMMTIMIALDPVMIAFSLGTLAISLIASNIMSKIRYDLDKEKIPMERKRDYIKRVFYLRPYAKELRLFPIPDLLNSQFHSVVGEIIHTVKKYSKKLSIWDGVVFIFNLVIGTIGSLLYLAFRVFNGFISLGDFTALLSGTSSLNNSLKGIISIIPSMNQNSMYIENFKTFCEYKPKHIKEKTESVFLLNVERGIEVEMNNITFAYPGQQTPSLKNVNLSIRKGEKIVLVGRNGVGKSTLIKILLGLYEPLEGEVYVNGIDRRLYQSESYLSQFAMVMQDYQLYAITIAENVLMRGILDEEADSVLVWTALEKVGMAEKVRNLPNGIFSVITKEFDPDGVEFSGGEMQKIAISRIFVRQSGMIILDEPSSALDPVAEHELFEILMDAAKDKTVIMISHRLTASRIADKICLMEEDGILEQGSHEELIQLNGQYAHMFSIQSDKYFSVEDAATNL